MARSNEDWFLRGEERPGKDMPPDVAPMSFADEDADGGEREFEVAVSRFRTVRQTARVTVKADCKVSAMEKAEEMAVDHGDEWSWEDVPDSEDCEDCEAESVERKDADESGDVVKDVRRFKVRLVRTEVREAWIDVGAEDVCAARRAAERLVDELDVDWNEIPDAPAVIEPMEAMPA